MNHSKAVSRITWPGESTLKWFNQSYLKCHFGRTSSSIHPKTKCLDLTFVMWIHALLATAKRKIPFLLLNGWTTGLVGHLIKTRGVSDGSSQLSRWDRMFPLIIICWTQRSYKFFKGIAPDSQHRSAPCDLVASGPWKTLLQSSSSWIQMNSQHPRVVSFQLPRKITLEAAFISHFSSRTSATWGKNHSWNAFITSGVVSSSHQCCRQLRIGAWHQHLQRTVSRPSLSGPVLQQLLGRQDRNETLQLHWSQHLSECWPPRWYKSCCRKMVSPGGPVYRKWFSHTCRSSHQQLQAFRYTDWKIGVRHPSAGTPSNLNQPPLLEEPNGPFGAVLCCLKLMQLPNGIYHHYLFKDSKIDPWSFWLSANSKLYPNARAASTIPVSEPKLPRRVTHKCGWICQTCRSVHRFQSKLLHMLCVEGNRGHNVRLRYGLW